MRKRLAGPRGGWLQSRFEAQRSTLTERGVSLVDLRKLHQGVAAEGYVIGEGYGYLKVVPDGATLGDCGPRAYRSPSSPLSCSRALKYSVLE